MKRKEIITLSTLGAIALAVILLYCFVFAPMLFERAEHKPPEIREGEGIYLNTYVTLYPEISSSDILSIDVENEHGSYGFYMTTDKNGNKQMLIKDYESLNYTEIVYAYLLAYTRLPVVPQDTNIYRDVDSEKMAEYGLTEESAQARFTIKYTENGEEKAQTVLIGNKILSSKSIYYATVLGRNHVYTMNGAGIEGAILKPLSSFINPLIYRNFDSASAAALAIDTFGLFVTQPNAEQLKTVLMLSKDKVQSGETGATYYLTCDKIYPQKVIASSTYITNAFGQLFTAFVGDEVMAIVPNDDTRDTVLEKYGLASTQEFFHIHASGSGSEKSLNMYISKQMGDYFYVLSEYYKEADVVVKVKASALSFLGEGEETAIKWAATNSVYAGFNDYLALKDNPDSIPTVYSIRLKTKANGMNYGGYEHTFVVSDSPHGGFLITSTDGLYSFDTSFNNPEQPDKKELFTTLYAVLVVMPKPQRFATMTEAEKEALEVEDNLLYELEVVLTNGVCKKYSYYFINSGYALCVSQLGSIKSENGVSSIVYDSKEAVFETSVSHISSVSRAYEMTLMGEHFIQNDFIT